MKILLLPVLGIYYFIKLGWKGFIRRRNEKIDDKFDKYGPIFFNEFLIDDGGIEFNPGDNFTVFLNVNDRMGRLSKFGKLIKKLNG